MYVRTREGLGQVQRPYISSSLHFGSYVGERETLVERLRAVWRTLNNKAEFFDFLRRQKRFPLESSMLAALQTMFAPGSDDGWLALNLAQFGPEPLWPLKQIMERVKRAQRWVLESGNIEATLPDPNPDPDRWSMPPEVPPDIADCYEKTRLQMEVHPVRAYFFPGLFSDRRALIISGVHGDEPSGVQVVQHLRTLLTERSAKGDPPDFTTILVPYVIPRTRRAGQREVPIGIGLDWRRNGRTRVPTVECHAVEPNRNFPLPGDGYDDARRRGATNPMEAELVILDSARRERPPVGTRTSIRMLPETRILIELIERFQPERLASIHAHSCKQECHHCDGRVTLCGGEGPGIFVDPRGIQPRYGRVLYSKQVKEDEQLACRMVGEGLSRVAGTALPRACTKYGRDKQVVVPPFAGNQACGRRVPLCPRSAGAPVTVRYYSKQRVEGNSLGDWAPVTAGNRLGITTLTIEVPQYRKSKALDDVINLHRDLLREIFLRVP